MWLAASFRFEPRFYALEGARAVQRPGQAGCPTLTRSTRAICIAVIAEVEAVKQQQYALMAVNQK